MKIKRIQTASEATHAPDSDSRFGFGIAIDSREEDEGADRALSSVARKLDKSMSVEYTVNELITSAMDISNLSQLFYGVCSVSPRLSFRG